ncbi:Testis- and ovary-specific PAZ domain-containing protein 1 [Triplophysa tibetana]|uniref:Protein TOPAZ1 n=1 Tax=Triplophysa tibetana TaxID=1572043 RepID=A0A5A9NLA1_9TELE|nr:Testis- and ovary-specific PAZ domain-containing protein 1 [Triplophysa tibetana]
MSGLNPPADRVTQAQDPSEDAPSAADVISSRNGDEPFSLRDSAEHDDGHAGYNKDRSSKVELRCLRSGTRKDLKRLVKNSCCALCGDVKYSLNPSKNMAHLLTNRPRAGCPGLTARRKSAGHISKPLLRPTAPNFQFEKYPMLKLCDIARVFSITSRDFSCVLPEVLTQNRRKRVQCLKKEFWFLMHPHRCGVKKHRSCKCVSETAEDGCVRNCDVYPDGNRIQVDGVVDGATPSICNDDAENTLLMNNVPEICEGTSSLELRVPPIILRRVPSVNGCGFGSEADSENGGLSLDQGEEDNETNDDLGAELNLLESFSCQRTQAYTFFYQSSCARVCKTWPFPRSGPPDELRSLLSGHRWIVTSSFPVTPTTSSCIPENNVQDTPCKEALEAQAASSMSVETLKAQCLSSSTSPSTAEQVTQKPVTHTLNSKPPYSGKRKRRRGFYSSTVTDSSSSADENERDSKPSSDEEHVEHDQPEFLRLNDDVTSHIKDRGVTASQSVKDCTVPKGFLDVSRAYEEDVLILDVIQDDPDLFGAVVAETVNKPGTLAKDHGETYTKFQTGNHCKIVWDLDTDSCGKSVPDLKLENMNDDRLRTVKEVESNKAQPSKGLQITSALKSETALDLNNNQEIKNANVYGIKFCMERIQKFCLVGNPNTVLRAVEVFMEYYSKCSPGVCFSQEIVNSLIFCLLNLGFLRKFVDIIKLLLTHKSLPSPEIVLAAFKHVRDRGLIDSISELIILTSKIVEAGCVFGVDQCEVMQSHLEMMQIPRQQMDIFLAVKCRALATNPQTAELSDLAQAVVRVEMLKHWEDWSALAHIFCGVCAGPHSTSELHRFYCCVTMALLKEPKDKLTLPYEPFAESASPSDDMVKITLGRIGVSLIFRYHRTREWNKGVKLVNVMFGLQIEFTTLKGFMGNEYKVSRCQLVTSATELFLHSGSIEGALKVLRADNWFVTSKVWPCDPADIDCRKRVLTLLAGRTSHRDTFDILANLPGLRQPITQGMVPETARLQNLIHKLGKQNNWSRARTLFNRESTAFVLGQLAFYSAVVCEQDSLFLPCSLTEIEMTLAFEMFITSLKAYLQAPTGPSQPIIITLRRQGEVEDVTESMYLAAGCRLLSAALIPNPKLSIRYTAVNQTQEQLFILVVAPPTNGLLKTSSGR